MTRNRPLSGYVPLGDLLKRSRLDRPLSDGDVWTTFLPPVTFPVYRNITDHSCLKVYHKDPAQAFSHGSRPTNGDSRVSGSANLTRMTSNVVDPTSILFAVKGRNVPLLPFNLPKLPKGGVSYCSPGLCLFASLQLV